MTEPLAVRVIDAMEAGIKTAKQNPKTEGDPMPDDYIAWCVWNALRRAGFEVVEVETP